MLTEILYGFKQTVNTFELNLSPRLQVCHIHEFLAKL